MKKLGLSIVSIMLLLVVLLSSNNGLKVNASYNVFENFTSDSYVLLDANSGTILVKHNENEELPVASICKLMTTLITLEKIDAGEIKLTDKFTASDYACSMEGSQAFLDAGSEYTVAELLKSVIVASGNDSAVVLAENISGSESAFVDLMNKRAKELGMNNTVYANSTGLEAPNQHSTAMDTSLILKQISTFDTYIKYSNIWMDKFVHPSGRETELVNTNRLIKYYSKCKSGKTGFTDDAGYCLASSATNGNLNLIAVTLKCDKAQDRFKESMDLFNYGFANFENVKVVDSNQIVKTLKTNCAKTDNANVRCKNDYYVVTKKGDKNNFDIKLNVQSKVDAPMKKGDKVGTAVVVNHGKVLTEIDVVLCEDIEKQNLPQIFNKISNNWNLI